MNHDAPPAKPFLARGAATVALAAAALLLMPLALLLARADGDGAGAGADPNPPRPALTPAQQRWSDAYAAEQAGSYSNAIALMQQIVKEGGEGYLAYLRLGWLHWRSGDPLGALPWYQRAYQKMPEAVNPLLGIMNCTAALQRTNDVLRAAKLVIQIDPLNYAANQKMGELAYARGDFALAAAYYGKLSAVFPEDIAIANSYAWSQLSLGKVQEARTIFENILIVAPGNPPAAQGFAACSNTRGGRGGEGRP